jgi:hypothetical protein
MAGFKYASEHETKEGIELICMGQPDVVMLHNKALYVLAVKPAITPCPQAIGMKHPFIVPLPHRVGMNMQ